MGWCEMPVRPSLEKDLEFNQFLLFTAAQRNKFLRWRDGTPAYGQAKIPWPDWV